MFQAQAQDSISYQGIKATEHPLLWPLITGFNPAAIPLPPTPVADTFFGISSFSRNHLVAFPGQMLNEKRPSFFNARSLRHLASFLASSKKMPGRRLH
jgi:hypothetical protein